MKNWYRCEKCGCYLDPGEGRICEECKKEKKILYNAVKPDKDGQYKLILRHQCINQ